MNQHHRDSARYDVIVVGARAAGAAAAMLLARWGLRVLVLDRGRYGSDTLSTLALMRAGVLQLHRWGLLDAVRAADTPPVRRTVFHYGDDAVVVDIKPADGVDALYAPRRTVLDRILVDAARQAGAEVRYRVAVDDLERDDAGRITGIVARDNRGRAVRARGRFVIGADGVNSRVARAVGAEVTRAGTAAAAVVYGFFRDVAGDAYEWAYRPDATAGLIPTNDGETCVFVGTRPERFGRVVRPDLSSGFDRILQDAAPAIARRVVRSEQTGRFRGFAGVKGYFRRAWGPGWALVGDAGYFKDPITAHGISDALRDAELVSRAVTEALAQPAQEASALAEYERVRNEVSLDLFEVSDRLASYDWTLDEVRQHLLDLSRAMSSEVQLLLALDKPLRQAIA